MSKKGPQTTGKPDTGGTGGGGTGSGAIRVDVGDLTEVVTRSIQRALNVQDISKFPGRIIIGFVMEPPDFLRGGGGGGNV